MPEKDLVSQRDASEITTPTGRVFSQAITDLSGNNSPYSDELVPIWGDKGFQIELTMMDFYGGLVPANELPRTIVVESFNLPNDDIGKKGY